MKLMRNRSEQWLAMLNTNLLGTINLTRAILPHFRGKKSGKLVFIGSENGWRAGAGNAAYSVTKFALEGLSPSFYLVLCA